MTMLAFLDDAHTPSATDSEPNHLMSDPGERARVSVSVHAEDPGFAWLDDDFVRAVSRILRLPSGWAGPGSRPVTREALVGALEFIRRRLPVTSPRPSVVPTAQGGIQLEWHLPGCDVEVEFDAHGNVCDVAVVDQRRGVDASAAALWELADELEITLKQAVQRAY